MLRTPRKLHQCRGIRLQKKVRTYFTIKPIDSGGIKSYAVFKRPRQFISHNRHIFLSPEGITERHAHKLDVFLLQVKQHFFRSIFHTAVLLVFCLFYRSANCCASSDYAPDGLQNESFSYGNHSLTVGNKKRMMHAIKRQRCLKRGNYPLTPLSLFYC